MWSLFSCWSPYLEENYFDHYGQVTLVIVEIIDTLVTLITLVTIVKMVNWDTKYDMVTLITKVIVIT